MIKAIRMSFKSIKIGIYKGEVIMKIFSNYLGYEYELLESGLYESGLFSLLKFNKY